MNIFLNFFKNKKNQTFLFYFFILFLLLFIIYNNFSVVNDFKKIENIRENFEKNKIVENKEYKDSDGDGLYDWQEVLYQTDIEKFDTDGDGVGDGNEVKNGRNPLVFGDGQEDEIEKIKIVQENILTLEKQKEDLEKIYQKQSDFQIKILELKNKTKISDEEIKIIFEEKERIKKIKINLNYFGKVIKNNSIEIINKEDLFNNMFLFFLPGNKKKIEDYMGEQEEYSLFLKNNSEYREMSEKEIQNLESFALSFLKISKLLKEKRVEDLDLDFLQKDLYESYKNMGNSILKILELIKENKKEEYIIFEYTSAVYLNIESRKNINSFIGINNIKFSPEEAGNIFVYSL